MVLFLHKPLCKRTSDETVLFGGLAALALGFLTFTPWGGSGESRGVLITQYFIGSVFIFSLGFPVTQALMLSCFSKLLGPIPQVKKKKKKRVRALFLSVLTHPLCRAGSWDGWHPLAVSPGWLALCLPAERIRTTTWWPCSSAPSAGFCCLQSCSWPGCTSGKEKGWCDRELAKAVLYPPVILSSVHYLAEAGSCFLFRFSMFVFFFFWADHEKPLMKLPAKMRTENNFFFFSYLFIRSVYTHRFRLVGGFSSVHCVNKITNPSTVFFFFSFLLGTR